MRDVRNDYEGGNMAARLMDDTRESARRFKQGDVGIGKPRAESRAAAIVRNVLGAGPAKA
jgi:hypothetical protein